MDMDGRVGEKVRNGGAFCNLALMGWLIARDDEWG